MTTAPTTKPAPITIPNTAAPHILVVSGEIVEQVDSLTLRCAAMTIDATTVDQAKAKAKELRALSAEITTMRKDSTSKLDAVIAAAIAAERSVTSRLDEAWKSLTTRTDAFIAAENARLEEERRKAREDAERLQKIENDRAEAERKRLQEKAELEADPDEPPAEIPVTAAAPVYITEKYVPPPIKPATKAKTTYDVEYIDATKVPINSAQGHLLRPIDTAELIRFLKGLPAGKREIPGAVRLVEIEGRAAK
jgi:hypothetical protein